MTVWSNLVLRWFSHFMSIPPLRYQTGAEVRVGDQVHYSGYPAEGVFVSDAECSGFLTGYEQWQGHERGFNDALPRRCGRFP